MRLAMVFIRLLRIAGLLPSHVAGIEVVLAIRIFARLLHVRIFVVVVGHEARSFGRKEQHPTGPQPLSSYQWPVLVQRVACFSQDQGVGTVCMYLPRGAWFKVSSVLVRFSPRNDAVSTIVVLHGTTTAFA
jgi:hypothetical protein